MPLKVNAGRPWTFKEEQRGCDLYGVGFSTSQVAGYLGRPESSVQTMLKRNGVTMRPRGRAPGTQSSIRNEEIVKAAFLYERMEMSINEVADAMDVSYTMARNRLKHAGVVFRENGEAQRLRSKRKQTA